MASFLVLSLVAIAGWVGWSLWINGIRSKGESALRSRHYQQAWESLNQYLSWKPGDTEARLLAARAARNLHRYKDARKYLDRCWVEKGDADAIQVEERLLAVQQGDSRPVPLLRERVLKEDDLALMILEVLIQYDMDTYQLQNALQGLNFYLKHRPRDVQALLGRAYVWERFLSFPDALDDYKKAVELEPENVKARLGLAKTLLIAGKPDEALSHWQWLSQRHPKKTEVRLGMARSHRRLGNLDKAQELVDALAKEPPREWEVLWEQGQIAIDQGEPEKAELWLQKATKAQPYDRRVWYSLYQSLQAQGKKEQAKKIDQKVRQLDRDVRRLHQVQQEVLKNPRDAKLRLEGGLLFLRNGEKPEGRKWLQMALHLDPNLREAKEALSSLPDSQ